MKKSRLKITVLILITAALIAGGALLYIKGRSGTGQDKTDLSSLPSSEAEPLLSDSYDYYGTLSAVDGSDAFGEAGFSFKDKLELKASINSLKDPDEGFFYEGWLVDPSVEGKFISTGELNKENDIWVNNFTSPVDYTSYTKYVLTIEPKDGDPAPADHVVEGTLSKNESSTTVSPTSQSKNGYISLADYQANAAAYSAGNTVLFFNASWCPTCKVLNESLNNQVADFPDNLTVVSVDYDKETDLKNKYGIKTQHSLVQIDAAGNEITSWAGGGDLQSITDQLK
jgi:thiol-disulfide isomerase/thioredoxin